MPISSHYASSGYWYRMQYIADFGRDETLNVGIVVICRQTGEIAITAFESNDSLKKTWRRSYQNFDYPDNDGEAGKCRLDHMFYSITAAVNKIRRFDSEPHTFDEKVEFLRGVKCKQGVHVQLTMALPIMIEITPQLEANKCFELYVRMK